MTAVWMLQHRCGPLATAVWMEAAVIGGLE